LEKDLSQIKPGVYPARLQVEALQCESLILLLLEQQGDFHLGSLDFLSSLSQLSLYAIYLSFQIQQLLPAFDYQSCLPAEDFNRLGDSLVWVLELLEIECLNQPEGLSALAGQGQQ
jgi:hypothetical protein